jgi:hypothetical protein
VRPIDFAPGAETMLNTLSSTPTVRAFGQIAGHIAKANDGLVRKGTDPRVRRICVDETTPAAQPWDRNKFGSTAERIATVESLIGVVKELQAQHTKDFPRGSKKQLEEDQHVLSAELAELMARPPADRPIGRPATIRIALEAIAADLEKHALGIRRADVAIYQAIFDFLCFAGSGRWFPSHAKIAAAANCCERTVGRGLYRLKHHGLLNWVSRSTRHSERIDPTRETRVQTSHAYFLDFKTEWRSPFTSASYNSAIAATCGSAYPRPLLSPYRPPHRRRRMFLPSARPSQASALLSPPQTDILAEYEASRFIDQKERLR